MTPNEEATFLADTPQGRIMVTVVRITPPYVRIEARRERGEDEDEPSHPDCSIIVVNNSSAVDVLIQLSEEGLPS